MSSYPHGYGLEGDALQSWINQFHDYQRNGHGQDFGMKSELHKMEKRIFGCLSDNAREREWKRQLRRAKWNAIKHKVAKWLRRWRLWPPAAAAA